MESIGSSLQVLKTKLKQTASLWAEGFREACCLHRVVIYCFRSKELAIRTGQCFLLNGFIFLGSMFLLQSLILPTLRWILPDQCPHINPQQASSCWSILRVYDFLRLGLTQLVYVFWFYPLYISSYILSTLWYGDIAKYGFFALANHRTDGAEGSSPKLSPKSNDTGIVDEPSNLEGVMIGIAEQVYSLLLLNIFFIEVYVSGFVPYVGKALSFLLLSWMYAYYCFEYKWNLSGLSLDKRLDLFESNWAFFAGFGNPCVLGIFFWSPLVSYGVMAILFPLFVLTATGSEAEDVIALQRRNWTGRGLGRLPIFFVANYLSMKLLSLLPTEQHGHLERKDL